MLPFQNRCVQNKIVFLPSALGKRSTKAEASCAGLEPSTGVPMISRSYFSAIEGSEEAMSKAGAFVDSAIASAMRLVLPVLEKYSTQIFMSRYFRWSLYIIFGGSDAEKRCVGSFNIFIEE